MVAKTEWFRGGYELEIAHQSHQGLKLGLMGAQSANGAEKEESKNFSRNIYYFNRTNSKPNHIEAKMYRFFSAFFLVRKKEEEEENRGL